MTKDTPDKEIHCEDETERALRLFVILTRAFTSVTDHARLDIARYDLKPSEFGVLELLYHKGPTPLGVVAEKVLLTTGSITYVVDQLEKQGLVTRSACPKDRRVCYAELTEAGRQKMRAIFPDHAAAIRKAVAGLSAEEQETAITLLKRLGLTAQDALS